MRFHFSDIFNLNLASEIPLLCAIAAILGIVFKLIMRKIKTGTKDEALNWFIETATIIERPFYIILWVYTLFFCAEIGCKKLSTSLTSSIPIARNIVLVVMVTASLLKSVARIEGVLKNSVDRARVDIASKLIIAVIYISASLTIMQVIGVNIDAVLALGGISGLAIGLASKDLLANFFGTAMIYFDRPFIIGEKIKIHGSRGEEGVIEKVDWRMTTIRTNDKKTLLVPNSTFTVCSIENASRLSHKILREKIRIYYKDTGQIPQVLQTLKALLHQTQWIDQKQITGVDIVNVSQDIITLELHGFGINNETLYHFASARNLLLIAIIDAIRGLGLELAPLWRDEV